MASKPQKKSGHIGDASEEVVLQLIG